MTVISHRLGLVFLVCVVMFGGSLSCGGSAEPKTVDNNPCISRAVSEAGEISAKLCPLDESWDTCRYKPKIEADLSAAVRECLK